MLERPFCQLASACHLLQWHFAPCFPLAVQHSLLQPSSCAAVAVLGRVATVTDYGTTLCSARLQSLPRRVHACCSSSQSCACWSSGDTGRLLHQVVHAKHARWCVVTHRAVPAPRGQPVIAAFTADSFGQPVAVRRRLSINYGSSKRKSKFVFVFLVP